MSICVRIGIVKHIAVKGTCSHFPTVSYFIIKCIKPARYFFNQILLTSDFFHDLAWLITFLTIYNGVTFYDQQFSRIPVHLDACLTSLGGHFGTMTYNLVIPQGYQNYDITQLEVVNIVVVSKMWSSHWSNKKVQIFCDNMAVVHVLTTGKARDSM